MLEVARDYVERQEGDQVVEGILSPVADTYGKIGLASAEHRLAMTKAAAGNANWIRADGWECSQVEYSFL